MDLMCLSKFKFIVLTAIISFSCPIDAWAQESYLDTLPTGIHASPGCEAPTEIWVLAVGHELYAADDTFYLAEVTAPGPEIVHGWRFYEDFFARAFADGAVEYLVWEGQNGASFPPEAQWPEILPQRNYAAGPDWFGARHVRCDSVPLPFSLLHGESARFLLDLEPAVRSCEAGSVRCLEELFAALDKVPDGELNVAELSRVIRVLLHLGVAVQDEPEVEASAAGTVASLALAQLVATAIISSYNYDGSHGVSYHEIAGELAGAGSLALRSGKGGPRDMARQALDQVRNNLQQLMPMLEVLK